MLTGGLRTRATMESVLAAGDIDVVGMARPLSYAPELPAQLLAGTADEPPPIDVYSRIKRVDNALQVFWFQEQLHRMGRGQEPDLELGRYDSRAAAQAGLAGVVGRGVRTARIVALPEPPSRLRIEPADAALRARLAAIGAPVLGVPLGTSFRACTAAEAR